MRQDPSKTKAELIGELAGLRRRVAELEAAEAQRKRVEEALRDSEERYRNVYDTAPLAFVIYDDQCRVTGWNDRAERMFGWSREEVLGKNFFEFLIPEAARPRVEDIVASLLRGEVEPDVVNENQTKPGEVILCRWNNSVLRDSAGRVVGAMSLGLDITEQRRADEALRRSEERFRQLFDDAPVGYHELDTEGKITRVNRTELAMLGRAAEEVLGRPAWEFVVESEAFKQVVAAKMKGTMPPGRSVERTLRRKDGTTLPVLIEDRLLRDEEGRIIGTRSIMQDITERKRAEKERRLLEAQIQHAQKLESLGVLAGGIAHDFNNLLTGIMGNADLALMDLSPASPARESLERVQAASHRAADLCRQLLAYSGKGRFAVEPIDLNELVEEMAHLLEVSVSKKAVLRYNFADHLPAVDADATQIRQVVMNLITNASEAIGDKSGVISVSTGAVDCDRAYLSETYLNEELPEGVFVYIEVADTGCGMDAETQEKIFDPFFTTKFTGRGLGLAAVIGIVRGHYGALKVHSEPGKGTTFKVLFPAADEPAEPLRKSGGGTGDWRGSGTVLLVDDEETVRTVARRMLEGAGFKVLTASNGHECLEAFREHADQIVCVLMDLTMPQMDGEETFRELRRIRRDVRVVLSSGYNEQDAIERFVGKGLAGFIHKPYESEALIAKIKQVLEG